MTGDLANIYFWEPNFMKSENQFLIEKLYFSYALRVGYIFYTEIAYFFSFFPVPTIASPSRETGRLASSSAATHTSHRPTDKGCVFQPGSKIVDLGFVKFKSNGTRAKRPLEQI